MNIEDLRIFCLSLQHTQESFPFDQKILAFSVFGKMFCLTNIDDYQWINIKCDPEKAIELREYYSDVTPAYHMNKKHWNSVNPQGKIPDTLLKQWITDSYHLVIKGLPQKLQKQFDFSIRKV